MHSKLISENYKKRLKELAGLDIISENRNAKLMKMGFNEEVSTLLNNIDSKRALFLGDISARDFAIRNNIDKTNLKEILPIINQNDLLEFIKRNEGSINLILEWITSPLRRGEIDFKQIKTLTQAFEMADEWHNSLEATGIINDESGEIVKRYPEEQMYWIDLKTNYSCEEGGAMGHCGKDRAATTLFSLRDKNKSPHVTIAYNQDSKTVTQVKGRANKRPVDKYMKFVYDFLREKSNNGELDNFKWSYGEDLNDNDIKQIFGPKKYFFYLKNNYKNVKSNIGVY